jgi:very-long-chain enoyl-CoA reductase
VALTDESRTIGSYGVKEGSQLQVKDLGKQIDYRVLYLWEYVSSLPVLHRETSRSATSASLP